LFSIFRKRRNKNEKSEITYISKNLENRREYFRVALNEKVLFRLDIAGNLTRWGECILVNISAGGAKILTNLDFPENVTVIVSFTIENQYTLSAEVVWKNKIHTIYQYGLKWCNINELRREKLLRELIRYYSEVELGNKKNK
jgi:c-di-GMP-binding flagellar brake protein YcgR